MLLAGRFGNIRQKGGGGGGSESTFWALPSIESYNIGANPVSFSFYSAYGWLNTNSCVMQSNCGVNSTHGFQNIQTVGIAPSAVCNTMNLNSSKFAEFTGFAFSLPASSTIEGIEVLIYPVKNGAGTVVFESIQLVQGGSTIGTAKTNQSFTNAADNIYGGVSDMWGTSLTQAQVESSTFGVTFNAKETAGTNTGLYNYAVMIRVTYSHGGSTWTYTDSGWQNFASASGTGWSNPSNALADDTSYATMGTITNDLNITNLSGLTLPSDAIVHGVDLELIVGTEWGGGGYAHHYEAGGGSSLINGGSRIGLPWATTWTNHSWGGSNFPTYRLFGGGQAHGGGVLTKTVVESSTFGIRLRAGYTSDAKKGVTGKVDYARCKVYYRTQS